MAERDPLDDRELHAAAARMVDDGTAVPRLKQLGRDALRGLRDAFVGSIRQRLGLAPKPRPPAR